MANFRHSCGTSQMCTWTLEIWTVTPGNSDRGKKNIQTPKLSQKYNMVITRNFISFSQLNLLKSSVYRNTNFCRLDTSPFSVCLYQTLRMDCNYGINLTVHMYVHVEILCNRDVDLNWHSWSLCKRFKNHCEGIMHL